MMTDADASSAATSTRLSEQINNATRSQHTTINRLISSRLPLCLPPHTSRPDLYLLGITQIAEIFYSFESVWEEVTSTSQLPSLENTWDSLETYPHPLAQVSAGEDSLITALRMLRPIGLARSARLKNDLVYLHCVCGIPEDDARSVATNGIKAHIETEVRANPHLLIAYAWTLYLAVFSGGRHIRSLLCEADEDFWLGRGATSSARREAVPTIEKKSSWNWRSPVARLTSSSPNTEASKPKSRKAKGVNELRTFEAKGLSFWFFPGPQDGEELRTEFKQRLQDLEVLLSVEQEMEIVAEAQAIFSRVEALVSELDTAAAVGTAVAAPAINRDRSEQEHIRDQFSPLEDQITTDVKAQTTTSVVPASLEQERLMTKNPRWLELPGYAGLAMVICGISWCAMYYGGTWSA